IGVEAGTHGAPLSEYSQPAELRGTSTVAAAAACTSGWVITVDGVAAGAGVPVVWAGASVGVAANPAMTINVSRPIRPARRAMLLRGMHTPLRTRRRCDRS